MARFITPDYFRAMGIPLRRGRVFNDQDKAGAPPVLVINDSPYGGAYPQLERELRTADVLCELLDAPESPTWERYRNELSALGLPVP